MYSAPSSTPYKTLSSLFAAAALEIFTWATKGFADNVKCLTPVYVPFISYECIYLAKPFPNSSVPKTSYFSIFKLDLMFFLNATLPSSSRSFTALYFADTSPET